MSRVTPPQGYRENAKGMLIPESKIRPSDLVIDKLVTETATEWLQMQGHLRQFKDRIFDRFKETLEVLNDKYKVKKGKNRSQKNKGNVTLVAFDGSYKLQMAVADLITLGPELQAAKALIEECKESWSKETSSEVVKTIVNSFTVDSKGNISVRKVLELLRYDFPDPRWKRAMAAIKDAITVTGSKEYVRLSKRTERGGYVQIPLDIAAL